MPLTSGNATSTSYADRSYSIVVMIGTLQGSKSVKGEIAKIQIGALDDICAFENAV